MSRIFRMNKYPPLMAGGRKKVILKKAENLVFSRDGVAKATPFSFAFIRVSSVLPKG